MAEINEDSKQAGTSESYKHGGTIKAQKVKSIEEEEKDTDQIKMEPPVTEGEKKERSAGKENETRIETNFGKERSQTMAVKGSESPTKSDLSAQKQNSSGKKLWGKLGTHLVNQVREEKNRVESITQSPQKSVVDEPQQETIKAAETT